ncbi:hypothetical protein ATCC90586_002882 [Pythium insidiosum]|nr:hypothetical protein ATCC90586_002882 [Pythium insidiosum]
MAIAWRRTALAARPWLRQRRWINYGHDMHKEMLNGTTKISVTEYDEGGFVVNDVNLRGGVALLPDIAMLWKPRRFEEITKESLEVFTIANPPVEILILGCGARIRHQLEPSVKEFLKVNGIVVEYLDSVRVCPRIIALHCTASAQGPHVSRSQVNACATFNILNAEDRKVAAAILPWDPTASVSSG